MSNYSFALPKTSPRPTARPTSHLGKRVKHDGVIAGAFGANAQPNAITNAFASYGSGGTWMLNNLDGLTTGTPVMTATNGDPTVNTTEVDGQAPWLNALSGLGAAVLDNLGAQRDGPAPELQPANFRASVSTGSPYMTWALIAAGVVGLYYVTKS